MSRGTSDFGFEAGMVVLVQNTQEPVMLCDAVALGLSPLTHFSTVKEQGNEAVATPEGS